MNQATTASATMNETTKPISNTVHSWPLMGMRPSASAPCLGWKVLSRSYPVAAIMVGMERKKENSSAAVRDMPATCPAAMVDMERDVPGNTAEATWQIPIQIACVRETSSMRSVM